MSIGQPANSAAPFLPTSVFYPESDEEKRVKEISTYRDIASNVNVRQIGSYDLQESVAGQFFFTPGNAQQKRQSFRKAVTFSPLVAGLNSFAHGIVGIGPNFTFTHIYGTGKNAAGTVQVPFPQGGANTSMLEIGPVNVNLTIPAAYAGFSCLIILEYLKN